MQVDSQIKAAEQQRKVQKDQQDFLLKNKELEIREEEADNRTHTEGVRMGIDIGKTREMANRPPRTRE
jgi:hypothetical protein